MTVWECSCEYCCDVWSHGEGRDDQGAMCGEGVPLGGGSFGEEGVPWVRWSHMGGGGAMGEGAMTTPSSCVTASLLTATHRK